MSNFAILWKDNEISQTNHFPIYFHIYFLINNMYGP